MAFLLSSCIDQFLLAAIFFCSTITPAAIPVLCFCHLLRSSFVDKRMSMIKDDCKVAYDVASTVLGGTKCSYWRTSAKALSTWSSW